MEQLATALIWWIAGRPAWLCFSIRNERKEWSARQILYQFEKLMRKHIEGKRLGLLTSQT